MRTLEQIYLDANAELFVPLYRAADLKTGALVSGYLMYYKSDNSYYIKDLDTEELYFTIDLFSLEMSFDYGETWMLADEVHLAVKQYKDSQK